MATTETYTNLENLTPATVSTGKSVALCNVTLKTLSEVLIYQYKNYTKAIVWIFLGCLRSVFVSSSNSF